MEYTRLGSSGLKISRVAMGTMSFGEGDSGREGWPIPYEDAVPFFRQALDLGHHLLGHRERLQLRHLGGGRRPGAQGAHPPRRHRRGDEGVLPGARRSGRVRSVT